MREETDPAILLVVTADKLHNARTQLRDYRELGDAFWSRFNAGRERQLWFYDELIDALRVNPAASAKLVNQLASVVMNLRAIEAEVRPR